MKTVRHANAGKNFLILAAADHVSAQILSMPLPTSFPRPVRTSARVQSATCPLSAKTDLTAKAPEHIANAFPKKGMKKRRIYRLFLVAAVGFEPTTYRV